MCKKLSEKLFVLLNQAGDKTDLIRDILLSVKKIAGFHAVGIRLKNGEDYPYYESNGFAEPTLQNETSKGWIQNAYDLLSGCYRYDLTKDFTPDTIQVNSEGTFTLSYENNGVHDMFNVTISDTIPTCLQFLNSTPAPTGNTNNYYWWVIPTIPKGSNATITVNYRAISLPTRGKKGGADE